MADYSYHSSAMQRFGAVYIILLTILGKCSKRWITQMSSWVFSCVAYSSCVLETEPAGNVLAPIDHTSSITITCRGKGILWNIGGHQDDWHGSISVAANETHSILTLTEQGIAMFNRSNLTVICYRRDSTNTGIADQGEYVYILRYGKLRTHNIQKKYTYHFLTQYQEYQHIQLMWLSLPPLLGSCGRDLLDCSLRFQSATTLPSPTPTQAHWSRYIYMYDHHHLHLYNYLGDSRSTVQSDLWGECGYRGSREYSMHSLLHFYHSPEWCRTEWASRHLSLMWDSLSLMC